MFTKTSIESHLKIALKEVGVIKPWFDEDFNAWIFSHEKYPDVEYAGDSEEEVNQNYPKYLREFIRHRLKGRLDPVIEKNTKGLAGKGNC